MVQHFNELERVGVTRIWLRNSDLSDVYPKPNSNCEWSYKAELEQKCSSKLLSFLGHSRKV